MATLKELANMVNGNLVGNPKLLINGVSTIDDGKPETITFIGYKKYNKYAPICKASAIIVNDKDLLDNLNGIVVNNPQEAIVKILEFFSPDYLEEKIIHKTAQIDSTAVIGKNVSIGQNTIIEKNVIIGDDTKIGANNVIESGTLIGKNCILSHNIHLYHNTEINEMCIIHSGAVIGSDGFGFFTNKDKHIKIPQNGRVIIGKNVEIGANCTFDRGTIGNTIIKDFCKFDNGVQIGHNALIGEGCLMAGHVTIGGSTKVGNYCAFGGQAGAIDHIKIGEKAIFACYTAAMKDLSGNKIYSGAPAREIKEKNRRDAVFIEVKQLKKRLKIIEDKYLN
jgi:UDP-3-O-[3-hydroxymyristoyl] glucosamine N-acyltransferase